MALFSEYQQKGHELYLHCPADSTYPSLEMDERKRNTNHIFQSNMQIPVLQLMMVLSFTRIYYSFLFIMIFITLVSCCEDESFECRNGTVITTSNYPLPYDKYEFKQWCITAPEGELILLTFNNFSLGPNSDVEVVDTADSEKTHRYDGGERTITPFLSKGSSLILRFRSTGEPTGSGFNISASCFSLSGARVGHLVGGSTPAEGFLELQTKSEGERFRVCEGNSADRLAGIVCMELGFPGVREVSYENGDCMSDGPGRRCIPAPICTEYTYLSQDCSISSEKCTSPKALKVKCFEPGSKGCYNLSNSQLENATSYESLSQCVTSCRKITSQDNIAIVHGDQCTCSTSDEIRLPSLRPSRTTSCTGQFVYNASVGFCTLLKVKNGSWNSKIAWFGSIVHLTCDRGYRPNRNETELQCVTKMSTSIPEWNHDIPTCEMEGDMMPTSGSLAETTNAFDPETSPSDQTGQKEGGSGGFQLPILTVIPMVLVSCIVGGTM